MTGSSSRILTTHAGSLPRPPELIELNRRRAAGEGSEEELAEQLRSAVADVVRRQADCGIDIVNDGEFGKAMVASVDYGAWLTYAYERLAGWEARDEEQQPLFMRDADEFPDFYGEMWQELDEGGSAAKIMTRVYTQPPTFVGQEAVRRDVENLRAAMSDAGAEQGFVTAIAPASFNRGQDRHFESERDFLFALA